MLLKGFRILDMSSLLPGPMCSLFLADLGAEVIKIESPKGDMMRYLEVESGKSPYFEALNRNKKSVVIDLKTKEGKSIFLKLAKEADVVIEGMRPGKASILGVGYDSVRRVNPRIVYCSISGYGRKGNYKNRAGHDLNYASLSGLLNAISLSPSVPGVQFADSAAALVAAISVLAALLHREKTGKGEHIDVSILKSAVSLVGMHIAHRSVSNKSDTILSGAMPCYNIYKTKDGKYVSLGAIETKFWASFCKSVKKEYLVGKQFDKKAVKELENIFLEKAQHEWLSLGKKHDFCCEPLKHLNEVIHDANLTGSGAIITLDNIKQAGYPALFSSFAALKYKSAPKLGQHTEEVLSRLKSKNSNKERRFKK